MNNPWEWNEADIQRLIRDAVKEDTHLEYKACAALDKKDDRKKDEVSKDVSAFANADGGTIVYGVTENKLVPTAIDVGYDPLDITSEWLDQVIHSRIQPHLNGVRINPVELPTERPGKVLYVVSVPRSTRAHMAADHRYHKRLNTTTTAMEDYEVRDVNRREEGPNLHLNISLRRSPQVLDFTEYTRGSYSQPIQLTIGLINQSPTPAEYILIALHIDRQLKITNPHDLIYKGESEIQIQQQEHYTKTLYKNWAIPRNMPVWEGTPFTITPEPLEIAVPRYDGGEYIIHWELQSPKMTPTQGAYELRTMEHGYYVTLIQL